MAKWAVFDVDGTLLPSISMERLFIRYCAKQRLVPIRNVFSFMLSIATSLMTGRINASLKSNKSFLKNLQTDRIETAAVQCFRNSIAPRFSQRGKDAVSLKRQQGYKILLLTGSPEFLARHLKPLYQPDKLVSYILEKKGNVYTGRGRNLHPYGRRKTEILLQLQQNLDLSFDESIVFANHHADVHHMELFGEAVAVNPTPKLQSIAREHGWTIARWD